jgi:probable F420-dependent oxidoreductase
VTHLGVAFPAQVAGVDRQDIRAFALNAERLGFDSLWVLDRLVYDSLAPLSLLALAAGLTERVRLGTSILLAGLHAPLPLAKELATIDRLSAGRLTVGVAVGGREVDFAAAGVEWRARGRRLEETIGLLRQAWRGEPIDHDGRALSIHAPAPGPRPSQPSGPPIWIGGRSQRALERAVRIGDGYIPGRSGPRALRTELQRVRAAAVDGGRDPASLPCAAVVFFNMDSDAQSALAQVTGYLRGYYGLPETLQPVDDTVYGPPRLAAARLREFVATGVDTLVLVPTRPCASQLDALAEAVALSQQEAS